MRYLNEEMKARKLPELMRFASGKPVSSVADWELRREEIRQILCKYEYGFVPDLPVDMSWEVKKKAEVFGAKAEQSDVEITLRSGDRAFTYPVQIFVPTERVRAASPRTVDGKLPVFLYIGFNNEHSRWVAEELIDNGYLLAYINYQEVAPDKEDGFEGGVSAFFPREQGKEDPGKIALWADAASRALDYVLTLPQADPARIAVIGHSRLGKTALFCGAMDDRIGLTIANDSGAGGVAVHRGKEGEHVSDLAKNFPFWFCGNFAEYANREGELPFDQHFVISLIAPRRLYVANAQEDLWADPCSEIIACKAASPVYELYGEEGLSLKPGRSIYKKQEELAEWGDSTIQIGRAYHEGHIGYHVRRGTHSLCREDWQLIMEYRDKTNS